MRKFSHILTVLILLSAVAGCTSARWTVKEKESVDKSDYEVIEERLFLQQADNVTPENPVLSMELFSETEYEYTQRVLMQRNIQDYRLRPGTVALGLGGAAMAFYLANFATFNGHSTSIKTWTLNGVGGLMLASGFLNMKPVGEPRPTGEERYLRSTGNTTEIDTVKADATIDTSASVYMLYNDLIIFEENNQSFSNEKLNIPVGKTLEELELSGLNPGNTTVEVLFADSLYQYTYPINSVLQPYATIKKQLVPLRNSPQENTDNVLADLVEGSQLKIDEIQDDWFKVLYGISETYIKSSDARIIWRSEDYTTEDQVVTVPRVPFGDIDVESNIPMLRQAKPNAKALLVINQNYHERLGERNYALRDGRLMRTYLQNALGYDRENIIQLADVSSRDSLEATISSIQETANDSTELFVYLSGFGGIDTTDSEIGLDFLLVNPSSQSDSTITINELISKIGSIPSAQTLMLTDIDFNRGDQAQQFSDNQVQQIIEKEVAPLVSSNSANAILMGSRLNNPSSLYMSEQGEDKKHHVFPYFFAKALQQRRTTISDIYQYLERNVSYTSRRLFDRPQNPLLLGNTQLNLASE